MGGFLFVGFFLNCGNNSTRSSIRAVLVFYSITLPLISEMGVGSGAAELNLTVCRN